MTRVGTPAGLSFSPPPVPAGSRYVRVYGNVHDLVARRRAESLQKAGLDAYWEQDQQDSGRMGPLNTLEYLCQVYVAEAHLICALILHRLSFRGVKGWQRMSPVRRRHLAERALVEGMLVLQATDDDAFDREGLRWLKEQLGLGDQGIRRLLDQARVAYQRINRRDVRWGLVLTVALILVGVAWGISGGTFTRWQVIVLLVLGGVFGVHTLVDSLPRWLRTRSFGVRPGDPYRPAATGPTATRGPAAPSRVGADEPEDLDQVERELLESPAAADDPNLALWRSIQQARDRLNQEDAAGALKVLESFISTDRVGRHTSCREFYETMRVCQEALGLDSRQAAADAVERRLDWHAALQKGEELLRAGRAEESIVYFERSLADNPLEAGTASGVEAARDGIKAAKATLKALERRNRRK